MSDVSDPVRPQVLVYVPHGGIPDRRGFSPSIVACEFAKRMRACVPYFVAAAEGDPRGPGQWERFPVERLPPRRLYTRLCKLGLRPPGITLAADFVDICKKAPPALIHAHQLEFPVRELRRRLGRRPPVIVHAHVVSQEPLEARGFAERYIAVSDYVGVSLAGMGYPPERIVTIRNGVDTRLFRAADSQEAVLAKEALGIDPRVPVLAFVGRKHDIKGYPAFLAVAERLLEDRRPLFILAVGADPERPTGEGGFMASRERERRLVATGRFRSLPAMPQADLAGLYRAIDVTLLPSLAETQGMAIIESLASGCVTISARVGGVRETLESGVTGFLVDDPHDTDALYEKTAHVLDNLPELVPLRAAARAYAVANLDWSVGAAQLEALYRTILG